MSGISMVLKNGKVDRRDSVKYSKMIEDTIKTHTKSGFLKYEMMFNAYHEDTLMDKYLSKYDYFGGTWHADSGGLQMVTQNKTITEELKDKIYEIQGKHSSYAMCFDEMPINVKNTAGIASRVDLSGRQYIVEWAKEKAIKTGQNIKRQIDIIKKMKSDTKVFIICQGNDTKSFVEYYNNVMTQLPDKEYHTFIAGVALSAACTGLGTLESVKMVASYRYMNIPEGMGRKLHLLGFGSITRLYPMLLLEVSGYLDADITFDSSSHAMKCLLGVVDISDPSTGIKSGTHTFGNINERSVYTDSIYTHLYRKYQNIFNTHYPNIDEAQYLAIVGIDHTTSKRFNKRRMTKDDIKKYNTSTKDSINIQLYTRFLVAYESFTTFSKNMEKVYKDIQQGRVKNGGVETTSINALIKVKTTEQYENWEKHYSRYVPSNKIQSFETLKEAVESDTNYIKDSQDSWVDKVELDKFLKKRKTKQNFTGTLEL
jgi:hypothetical protein